MNAVKKSIAIFLVIITILSTFSVATPVFAAGNLFGKTTDDFYVQEEMTSKIASEVTELRNEYEKHFVCEDGSFVVATYNDPVHYKENGQWKEIDNSLKLTADKKDGSGKSMYSPKAGIVDVEIPQSFSNGQKVSATNKGYTISFGANHDKIIQKNKPTAVVKDVENLASSKIADKSIVAQKTVATTTTISNDVDITTFNNDAMAVDNQSGAVVYENVFGNDDLEYIVTTNSIKENIVVNEKQDNYIYSFDMDFGELTPIVNEDNSIRVVNPEDTEETIFYIEAPYMYDANEVESTAIEMSLVEEDGIYVMTLQADAEWMNASERVFPVVIDPTVYLSFDDVFVMDGLLNKNTTKVNNELRVGRNLTNLTRTYIKPTLPTNIPAGSYISSAYLKLIKDAYYQAPSASTISVRAYDCYDVNSWNPTNITWENQPYSNSDNGYSSGHSYLSSVSATSSKTTYSFGITAAVRRWLEGGVNNGIMLASSNESTKTQIDFHSSRASDSSNYPKMYITYTAPSLSVTAWETDSQSSTKSFTIRTGKDWTAYTDADWITLNATSGTPSSGSSTNKIVVSENTSVEDRIGTVTVKFGNTVIGTIAVTQYGADPYITVDTTELSFESGNNSQTVNIESNTVWSFGDLPDWITVTPSTGSKNATVEISVADNYESTVTRESVITVTADTASQTVNISQNYDSVPPAAPNLYEEGGLVYISAHSVGFDVSKDSPEHVEYKLGDGEWIDYEDEPLAIIRSYDTTIYARTCDVAGNISEVTSLVLECELGEYTASYTDIALGEGVLPIGFERTYSSEDGWFFTFEANIAEYTNGYVFTDFYGNKQYYILNNEGKYVSSYGEELLIVEDGEIRQTEFLYKVPYGEMVCYFNDNGKLAAVEDDYNLATYLWDSNNIYITDKASNNHSIRLSNGKPIYISASSLNITDEDNAIITKESRNVQYQWTDGNLTKFIDASNVEHTYGYTNGLLTTNEDETIVYADNGRVKKISQANGAFVTYTYNDTAASVDEETPGNIGAVTVSDSKGVTDVWCYVDGFAISNGLYSYSDDATYNPNNISGAITTDTLSQVAYVITVPADEESVTVYEEYPLYEEDDNGNYTFYSYDSENNVTATLFVKAEALTVTETTTFEQAEAVAEQKAEYSYDTNGNVTSEIYQKRIDGTLVNQEKTLYTYTVEKSIEKQQDYQWLDNTWYLTYEESYGYNDYGNVTSKETKTYTNTENSDTGMIEVSSDTTTVAYKYDAWCQQISETINRGEEKTITETEYDVFGRTTSVTADGKTTTYTYDGRGNVLTITEDGETTTYSYADNGNLISRTNPGGSVAGYSYDAYGNLTGHTFNGYTFTYNTLGSILTASSESGELVNYTYSNTVEQEVLTSNFGNGQSIVYTYNEDGEITAIKLGEETKYGYEYFETTDENGAVTKEWTELTDYVNNLKKTIEENKTTVKDLNGNFIYSVENVSADDEVENSFDGVITTIGNDVYTLISEENKDTFKTNGTVDFTREYTYVNDDLTNVKTAGLTTSFDYNADKLISVLENTLNDVSKIYGYTYDDNGNITAETVTTKDANGNVVLTETIIYTYDDKEQLISAETSTIKYEYTYDDRGNILTEKEYAVTVDGNGEKVYTLIEANTDTYVYDETWKDKLISYNGQTITYDAVGNPTNYMGNALTWTMGRQLASFGDISYTYNEDGIRTSKTSNGVTTKFYLDGTNIIEQTNGTTTLYFFYDSVGEIIGFKYNGNNYLYVKNSMGDIVGIADAAGNLIASYTYDAWGKVTSLTGSNTAIGELNPFRYRSYYYDSDIQLYYLQSRYYDPEIGRFINSDDVNYLGMTESELSYNAFSYCDNNPVNDSDPNGYFSVKEVFDVFKSAIDTLINIVQYIKSSFAKELKDITSEIKKLSNKNKKYVKNIKGLIKECDDLVKKLGKVGHILTAITIISTVCSVYKNPSSLPGVLVEEIIDAFKDLVIFGTSTIIGKFSKNIPGVGYLLSVFVTIVIETSMKAYFTNQRMQKITTKFKTSFSKISSFNVKTLVSTCVKSLYA